MRGPKETHSETGGSLVATLIFAGLAGIALIAFLSLLSMNQKSVVRGEAWNFAMPAAEAGVDEALAHLNKNYNTNLLHGGWAIGGGVIERQRQLGDMSYRVSFTPVDFTTILSTGYVRIPATGAQVSRAVRVTALYTGVVNNAVFVKDGVRLNGFPLNTDSYDSSDPMHSGPGGVYDPAERKDGGSIVLLSDQPGTFNSGNSQIYGRVAVGENSYVDMGPGGSIGSIAWHTNGSTGIEPGWFSDDANGEMPDVEPPFTSAPPPPGGSVNYDGTNYSTVLPTGQFELSTFRGKVLVTGNATLLVTDRLQFSGQDVIRILPGASLTLYVAARDAAIGGQGVINESGNTSAFTYYGLPSNEFLTISGGGELAGMIYAPSAEVTLNGGGNVYGAVMARAVVLNGGTNIHLDEALNKRPDIPKRFFIRSWDEI